ncbi:hypothetical protein AB2S62_21695 [Vibrio sp. NTOU-M3]|uniref:hypothetical protein n=1 Tax=Vibrio sp. NTOU-M3 TaxID=3234954 RepID=UPI00349F99E6
MKKIILSAISLVVLAGCGGGDGGESAPSSYQKDGLYFNEASLAVMLIDTELSQNSMLVGDYSTNSFYFNDTHTTQGNTITTTGLSYVDNAVYAYDSQLNTTITISESGADISAVVNGQNMMYSFDRTSSSLPVTEFVGTHTNPNDGSTWTINSDGSFSVNGICTISGVLTRKDEYYTASNVEASGCANPAFNGTDYYARLVTVKHQDHHHLMAAMSNTNNFIWGSAPF